MMIHRINKSITKSITISLGLAKMQILNKSRKNINNLPRNSIQIEKMEMLKNSNNSMKLTKLSLIPKKEECMISMDLMVVLKETILWICSLEVEEEVELEALEDVNKCQRLNLPKKHLMLLLKIFTMAKSLSLNIPEQDAAKNAVVKEGKVSKNANNVKERVSLFKCIKWAQACINKFKSTVINVADKDKLYLKEENVKVAMEKRSLKRQKPSKSQLKREHQIIIQLLFPAKEIKSQMLWLVIWS